MAKWNEVMTFVIPQVILEICGWGMRNDLSDRLAEVQFR